MRFEKIARGNRSSWENKMKRREFLGGFAAFAAMGATGVQARQADEPNTVYHVGDASITLNEYTHGSGLTYFAPHDSENTAVAAAKAVVAAEGGRVLWLSHRGTRNIRFVHAGVRYEFDPNRMFTDLGAKASLKSQGANHFSNEALAMVRGFAKDVIGQIRTPGLRRGMIVGLHNNTNANYSVQSYLAGGGMEAEAADVFAVEGHDADDFYFVTARAHFAYFKAKGYNVALQSRRPTNDGSLSVYWASQGKPYINAEAQAGHSAMQKEMLGLVAALG
jgi:hypothetical protein